MRRPAHQFRLGQQADGGGGTFGLGKLSVLETEIRVSRDGGGLVKVGLVAAVGEVMQRDGVGVSMERDGLVVNCRERERETGRCYGTVGFLHADVSTIHNHISDSLLLYVCMNNRRYITVETYQTKTRSMQLNYFSVTPHESSMMYWIFTGPRGTTQRHCLPLWEFKNLQDKKGWYNSQ